MTISEKLTELLSEHSLSRKDLCVKIGVSESIVTRWIKHNTPIKLTNLLSLCKLFNCSLDFICGRTENIGTLSQKSITFPENLEYLLNTSAIAKKEIFLSLGMNRHCIYDWRNGSQILSDSLILLANYFDCTVDYLVGLE